MGLKLNLGCAHNKCEGWVNVDINETHQPDVICDLTQAPWPWDDHSVDEVLAWHVLEHLGETTEAWFTVLRELYRVCKHGAKIRFAVPHPRHDDFLTDPTHVRPLTFRQLEMYNQELNHQWIAKKWANTTLGLYLGVDFRLLEQEYILESHVYQRLERGEINSAQVQELVLTQNNICKELRGVLQVHKSETNEAPKPTWIKMPMLPVAWGEVFDKLTILEIKAERLSDAAKIANVEREKQEILRVVGDMSRYPAALPTLVAELREINGKLWDIEDGKRACERTQTFDAHFIELARAVYKGNDLRAEIKRKINDCLGSTLKEEKSHAAY